MLCEGIYGRPGEGKQSVIRFTDNTGTEYSFDERRRIGDPSGAGAVFVG